MRELIEKIGLDEKLKSNLINLLENDEKRIIDLADSCKKNGFASLFIKDDMTKLACAIAYADRYTKEEYKSLNIPESVFYDTMGDIAIWCENNHNKGLKNINWIQNHLKAELFRIGRLQYQLYTCNNKTLDYDRLPFNQGDKMIYIHIPQGEKLIYASCVESIKCAKEFFNQHFPEFEYTFFFCESWLLFGDNWMFMSPSSNILQFQSLFSIEYSAPDDKQAIERIFGKRRIIKALYPANTTLQKQAKDFMLHKGKLGIGIGIIHKNEI